MKTAEASEPMGLDFWGYFWQGKGAEPCIINTICRQSLRGWCGGRLPSRNQARHYPGVDAIVMTQLGLEVNRIGNGLGLLLGWDNTPVNVLV